ncbi:hypothetical protein LTR50_006944 [Elasticomyces elasticus]|nr:hypothetical protein LTR50_006944 [Elasticomyces elasticus]
MAGKALKDVTALNRCSGCGRMKRMHVLCPYCVQSIRRWFSTGWKTQKELDAEKEQIKEAKKSKAGPNAPRVTEKKKDRDNV